MHFGILSLPYLSRTFHLHYSGSSFHLQAPRYHELRQANSSPANTTHRRGREDAPCGELEGLEVGTLCLSSNQVSLLTAEARLSRPSLTQQHALPRSSKTSEQPISPKAALSYPTANEDDLFVLSPLLRLPQAFGSAYVGETFSCTLCANNELLPSARDRSVSSVRIAADMQTPSNPNGSPIQFTDINGKDAAPDGANLTPGDSLQQIVRFELKEEGNHVLAVQVTYTETSLRDSGDGQPPIPSGGRVRTFRKLYQFVAQQLMNVRTKAGALSSSLTGSEMYVLEAQLENMGEEAISLETVAIDAKSPFKSTPLNWELLPNGALPAHNPVLQPRDVVQVAFLLEQLKQNDEQTIPSNDKKTVLGQMAIQWRSAMGDKGTLRTGWLTSIKT